MNQHPDAAPPCAEPTGMMSDTTGPDFLCQRGRGHPGPHEVMTREGHHLAWGLLSSFPPNEDDDDD